jgi:tetratricopeptide (TPR) repeat protein
LRDRAAGGGGGVFAAKPEMNTSKNLAWVLWIVLALGFAGVWQLQRKIDVQRAAFAEEQDELVVRSAKLTKLMSMEFAPLLADVYWTRAVQYYGNKHMQKAKGLDLLWPLLDMTTTLDPNLLPAYRFGAMFLGDKPPAGAGRPDLAIQLIERGIRENPDYWRFYEDLGFIYYFNLKDYAKASQAFLEGSKNPDAQIWMKVMAASIAAEGNSRATSKFLWSEIYQSTKDELVKKNALDHLKLMKVEEDCEALDALNDEYARRTGHRAKRVRELLDAGMVRRLPVDPEGFPYVIGEDGKAELNLQSPLLETQVLLAPKE